MTASSGGVYTQWRRQKHANERQNFYRYFEKIYYCVYNDKVSWLKDFLIRG